MNKKTEGKILDIAAEILVSPLAAYAKAYEIKEKIAGSETYEKTKEAAKSAGKDIKHAAKKAYESESVQKGISAVKGTAKKVSESETYQKAKDGAEKGIQTAKEGVKNAMTRLGFEKKEEENKEAPEDVPQPECACAEPEDVCTEPEDACAEPEDACAEAETEKEEGIEDVIEEVDLSDIITEEEAQEEIPE